jgi:hypothetical protein
MIALGSDKEIDLAELRYTSGDEIEENIPEDRIYNSSSTELKGWL